MQFGILPYPFTVLPNLLPVGIVYPWIALVPFYLQNLDSSIKGQGEVSPNEFIYHLVVLERSLPLTVTSFPSVLTSKYVLYSSSGGYIH